MPHLVEKIKGFPLKAKSFRNNATHQKLWGGVPSIPLVPQWGYERPRVNRDLKIRGKGTRSGLRFRLTSEKLERILLLKEVKPSPGLKMINSVS